MAMFTGFKPQGLQKIASRMGYAGEMDKFDQYLEQNPDKQREMIVYQSKAQQMARGGSVRRFAEGGDNVSILPIEDTGTPIDNLVSPMSPKPNATEEEKQALEDKFPQGNPFPIGDGTAETTPVPTSPVLTPDPLDTSKGTDTTTPIDKPKLNVPDFAIDKPKVNVPDFAIDQNFYNSPEFKEFESTRGGIETMDYVKSPYFGGVSSGSVAKRQDAAYQAYAKRKGFDANSNFVDPRDNITPTPITPVPTGTANPLPQQPTPVADYTKQVAQVYAKDTPVLDADGNPTLDADGNAILYTEDTPVLDADGNQVFNTQGMNITEVAAQRMSAPALPSGGQVVGQGITQEEGQYIPTDAGQVEGAVAVPTSLATTTQAELPTETAANVMTADTTQANVTDALNSVDAATGTLDPKSKVIAAQQTKSAVSDLSAAQGTATLLENPVQRKIETGELITGVADAETASNYTEQIQAATATPSEKATVAGQLETLTADFDASNPPAWAAGTLRAVQAQMAARGLGASSMAGQAMIQGALESALPIAQADAATNASFEAQNLSNRQARAMLAAQQRATFIGQEFDQAFQARVQNSARVADVANQNFTAEQSIALENSRVANTMNLQNLSNSQALVMAEASALANLDTANLSNRQQSAVQNAQAFLQTDMANLANEQQTILFKAQQRIQSLFTDTAASNAAKQFNASSENQTEQFFANLSSQTAQFNATQSNAQSQYNAGQRNVVERFNAELNNQRDTFNAQNRLVIDQNNATWRRQVATADTATVNRVNEINATNLLATSTQAYNNLWNYYGDTMEWAWTSAENELNRYADMSIANLNADTQSEVAKRGESTAAGSAIGSLIGTLGSAYIASTFCWVAREVYGKGDPRWYVFRMWLKHKAPKWFKNMYEEYGEDYAKFIKKKPVWKWLTKKLMDLVVEKKRMVSHV